MSCRFDNEIRAEFDFYRLQIFVLLYLFVCLTICCNSSPVFRSGIRFTVNIIGAKTQYKAMVWNT